MFDLFGSRKKLKALFGTYVPAELVREMAKAGAYPVNHLERKRIHFLFVAVDGESEGEIGQRLGSVMATASDNGWSTCFLCSNLAVLVGEGALGNLPVKKSRAELSQRLVEHFGHNCKSLGEERMVAWGDYGSPTRRVFGPLLPDFLQLVAALERQPFGSHEALDAR